MYFYPPPPPPPAPVWPPNYITKYDWSPVGCWLHGPRLRGTIEEGRTTLFATKENRKAGQTPPPLPVDKILKSSIVHTYLFVGFLIFT